MIVADLVATLSVDDQMSAGLSKAGQSVENLAKVSDGSYRAIGGAMAGVGAAMTAPLIDAASAASDYSQAFADILAVGGKDARRYADDIDDTVKSLAAGTRYNAVEAAAGFEELVKAGLSVEDAMGGGLAGALDLAAAGAIPVARAAEVMTQQLTTFGDAMQYVSDRDADGYISTLEKAQHLNDLFAQSAATSQTDISGLGDSFENAGASLLNMGQDFETGVALLTAMSAFGTEGAEAGTALKSMANGLVKNSDALEGIGVGVFDDAGNFRDLIDIFEDLDAVTEGWSEGDRKKFLLDTFDSYGEKAASQLLDANDKIGKSLSEIEHDLLVEGAAAEMAAARMESFPGHVEAMTGALERLKLEVGEPILETLTPGVDFAADAINGLAEQFGELPKPVKKAVTGLVGATGALSTLGGAALFAYPTLRSMGRSFQELKGAGGIVGGLARGAGMLLRFAGPVGLAAAAGLAAYETNFLGFGDAVRRMAQQIQSALPAARVALTDFWNEIKTRGGDFADAVRSGDFQAASDIAATALQDVSGWAQEQLNRGGSWLEGLDIGGMLTLDGTTLADISTAGASLGALIGEKLVAGLQGAGGIKDYLAQNLPGVLSGAGGAKDTLTSALTRTFDDLMTPIDSMGGPGERGEAFGSAANVLSGVSGFFGSLADAMAAEFEAAFDSGALPTPSADFILDPLREMMEAAVQGVQGLFDPLIQATQQAVVDALRAADALPGVDVTATLREWEDALYGPRYRELSALYGGGPSTFIEDSAKDLEAAYAEATEIETAAAREYNAASDRVVQDTYQETQDFYKDLPASEGIDPSTILPNLGGKLAELLGGATPVGPLAQGAAGLADALIGGPGAAAAAGATSDIQSLIQNEQARQAELQTLLAEKQETAQLTRLVASADQQVAQFNAAQWGQTSGYNAVEDTRAQASQVMATDTGAQAAGGDMAAQVQQQFAAANAAASAGMTQLTTTITSGMATLTSTASASLSSFATSVQTSMTTAFSTAAAAAQAGMQAIVAAVQSGIAQIQAAAGQAQAAGAAIGQGLVAGLNSQLGAVQSAAAALGAAAEAGVQSTVQMGSPSQMAIPYGQSIGEGLIFGMDQVSPEVRQAAEALGYSAEQGLQPLMDGLSTTGAAAGKALGLDMEQLLAEEINGMEGWDPKSQIDYEAMAAFDDAAVKMARYGKRAGDDAASKAGEAFQGLADNMSAVLMGSETYLSDELARSALRSYRRLDADAKAKLPDGIKDQLKATYDEANITIGDVIKQRMAGAGMDRLSGGGLGAMFKERKEMILRGMLGQRTLEQKAQAAAADGLSLAIDSIKQGLMQGGQDAQSAMKGAIDSALGGGPGEAMKPGMLGGGMPGMGGADPEEFAWALCECITGGMTESLAQAGIGESSALNTLGHDLEGSIGGLADSPFVHSMRDAANEIGSMHDASWLGGADPASCLNLCDQAAKEMGGAAGDAAGVAMGSSMPAMPSAGDFGKAAGGALNDSMSAQCVSLCGGTVDDLAGGVAGGLQDAGIAEMAAKNATVDVGTAGARELGKQLRGSIPGATTPTMPGASPDDMASGVADGLTSQCVSLCDDSGLGGAADSLDSAASGMSDLGGQISQLTNSLIGQKFSETMKGIQDGLSGGGATGGIPSGVEVPALIHQLNPNINRALNFDLAQTNPHAAALLGGGSPVHLSGGGGNPFAGKTPGSAPASTSEKHEVNLDVTLNVDGKTLGSTMLKNIVPGLGIAAQNRQRSPGEIVRR